MHKQTQHGLSRLSDRPNGLHAGLENWFENPGV